MSARKVGMAMLDEEYEEVIRKFLSTLTPAQRLEGLTLEERLKGLSTEQRRAALAALDRDQQALALPVEVLRVLPEEYIRSLSAAVQEKVRARIQQDPNRRTT